MKRRQFLTSISIIPLLIAEKNSAAQTSLETSRKAQLNTTPIAGFEFYDGEKLWPQLEINHTLELIRETKPDDKNAISVNWKSYTLGYIPAGTNTPFASLMDKGHQLTAKIAQLKQSDDPWERIEIAIYLEVTV